MEKIKAPGWAPMDFTVERYKEGRLLSNDTHDIHIIAYDKSNCFLCDGALANCVEEVLADVLDSRYRKAKFALTAIEALKE